jgi:hypothetical protein
LDTPIKLATQHVRDDQSGFVKMMIRHSAFSHDEELREMYSSRKYYSCRQIKKENSGARGMYGGEEKCMQSSGRENIRTQTTWKT